MPYVIRILIIFVFFLVLPSGSHGFSFSEARTRMQQENESLKAAAANAESKREAAKSLEFLHGPTISAQAFEVWGETHVDLDRSVSTPLGRMPLHVEENYNFSGPRASITGTMPIFTGGKIPAAQKAAKSAADEAEAQARSRNVDLEAELIGKYFGLQLALSIEQLRMKTLEEQNLELARARKFEEEGMISPVERMSVQVARDAAERECLKARDNARTARLQLQRLLLMDKVPELTTHLFVLAKPLSGMEGWVEQALATNPQIAIADARVQQSEQGVAASKSAFSPQVFAFGEYSLIRHYQTMIEPTWMAGLGLNLTLWSAQDRRADLKSSRAVSREARAMRADVANQVRTDTETAWLNTQSAREQYNLTASTVELARENLRLKTKGFGEGMFTALDVTQARDQLLAAEVERRVAAFDFVVNYALLYILTGQMDEFMRAYNAHEVIIEK